MAGAGRLADGPHVVRKEVGLGILQGSELVEFDVDGTHLLTTREFIGSEYVSTRTIRDEIHRAIAKDTEPLKCLPPKLQKIRQQKFQVRSRAAGKNTDNARLDRIESILKSILEKLSE